MRAAWIISGVVQGVGFRYFIQRRAAELGVRGWVKNLPDGRVEVAASGNEGQLVTLEQYLQAGPRHSHVEVVEKIEISVEVDSLKSFDIR